MGSRLDLQNKLEELLDSKNVYYQPPEDFKMSYPAIIYSKDDIEARYANNNKYNKTNKYNIIVIDRLPDNKVIDKILNLPLSSYDRWYSSDNLNHDSIILYY